MKHNRRARAAVRRALNDLTLCEQPQPGLQIVAATDKAAL
jgi:hypothetical protein